MRQTTKELGISSLLFLLLSAHSNLALSQSADPKECFEKTAISGFPVRPEVLLQYVTSADISAMRMHEWDIFSALINQGGHPVWEDWDSKCEVNLTTVGCSTAQGLPLANGIRGLEFPVEMIPIYRQVNRRSATAFAYNFGQLLADLNNGPVLASVRFNPEAACHLLSKNLTSVAQLQGLLQDHRAHPSDASKAAIPSFAPSAIAVKLDWEFLEEVAGVNGAPTRYYLHVFDPIVLKPADPGSGGSYQLADTPAARVEILPRGECQNRDYIGEPIPLSCFYSLPVTDLTLPSNSLIIHLGFQLLQGAGPHYVVLVGVHVTTKEIPDWAWATFYWSRRALDQTLRENQNRPAGVKTPWNHYSMLTTFNADRPRDSATGGQPIAGSPYLEGKLSHGASSNCLFCHQFASFAGGSSPRDSRAVGSPPYINGKRQVDAAMEKAFLANSLGTDFLWSLADVSVSQEQRFLEQFELYLQQEKNNH